MVRDILIVGGGIAGLASALSLSKSLAALEDPDFQIHVFERHSGMPETGGAISLTPAAQRHLDTLGVLEELDGMGPDGGVEVDEIELFALRSGRPLGPIRFADDYGQTEKKKRYKGRRVMRMHLSRAMLNTLRRMNNVAVYYGKKLVGGRETASGVTLKFEDGSTATGDLVLGCDGVHSVTRTQLVDAGRASEYTGVSFLQSTIDSAGALHSRPHFECTAMHLSQQGSLLASFCDPGKTKIFLAGIIDLGEQLIERLREEEDSSSSSSSSNSSNNNSELARYHVKMTLQYLARERFARSPLPFVSEMVTQTQDWSLYPVYQVPPGGKWYTERILLLGDAAHALPPRDESAAYALGDAIQISRLLVNYHDRPLIEVFQAYERQRRVLVQTAFDRSRRLWQRTHDMRLLPGQLKELLTPVDLRPSSCSSSLHTPAAPVPSHEGFSDLSIYSLTREALDQ
ncbi:hypothetical protein ASPZODRAFT_149959 [Penicilliopsis zonata CBS 506.65]|uniref:FAD-binding domain-containing protein n=1 Tax=Penicilliopsis zonata CBS 506.65 TaxID=1073090 RepID=A0A1L9SP08_9EURO|nr:hypothetical protein ASPZODRAFT_149959 [Penicilliopsis zonata CBS 506.65]OJJ48992.1 hypothetical protein ASPZODRAFT_149959 [Penicilliopsis zonata CBS 506.65]